MSKAKDQTHLAISGKAVVPTVRTYSKRRPHQRVQRTSKVGIFTPQRSNLKEASDIAANTPLDRPIQMDTREKYMSSENFAARKSRSFETWEESSMLEQYWQSRAKVKEWLKKTEPFIGVASPEPLTKDLALSVDPECVSNNTDGKFTTRSRNETETTWRTTYYAETGLTDTDYTSYPDIEVPRHAVERHEPELLFTTTYFTATDDMIAVPEIEAPRDAGHSPGINIISPVKSMELTVMTEVEEKMQPFPGEPCTFRESADLTNNVHAQEPQFNSTLLTAETAKPIHQVPIFSKVSPIPGLSSDVKRHGPHAGSHSHQVVGKDAQSGQTGKRNRGTIKQMKVPGTPQEQRRYPLRAYRKCTPTAGMLSTIAPHARSGGVGGKSKQKHTQTPRFGTTLLEPKKQATLQPLTSTPISSDPRHEAPAFKPYYSSRRGTRKSVNEQTAPPIATVEEKLTENKQSVKLSKTRKKSPPAAEKGPGRQSLSSPKEKDPAHEGLEDCRTTPSIPVMNLQLDHQDGNHQTPTEVEVKDDTRSHSNVVSQEEQKQLVARKKRFTSTPTRENSITSFSVSLSVVPSTASTDEGLHIQHSREINSEEIHVTDSYIESAGATCTTPDQPVEQALEKEEKNPTIEDSNIRERSTPKKSLSTRKKSAKPRGKTVNGPKTRKRPKCVADIPTCLICTFCETAPIYIKSKVLRKTIPLDLYRKMNKNQPRDITECWDDIVTKGHAKKSAPQ